jgi:hypothetical protein
MRKSLRSLMVGVPVLSLVTGAFAVMGGACSSNKPPPPTTPTADAGMTGAGEGGAPIGVAPAGDAGAPVASNTGPTFFTNQDAGTAPTPTGTTSTAPTAPVLTEQALDGAIDIALVAASPKVAPKMNKEGATGRATLKEGEHFGMVVTLQPNTCYTFIAFSPPGQISQVDMKLMGVALAVEAGKSSPPDKALPGLSVMGKGGTPICPVLPVPVPYKVDVVATKGAGRMGVQGFSRPK